MPQAFDTSARVAAVQIQMYRTLGEAQRAEIVADLSDALRDFAAAGVRQRHPEYDDDRVQREVLAVFYGRGRTSL
jgi:hypothetical protein